MDKGSWVIYIILSLTGALLILIYTVSLHDSYYTPLEEKETQIVSQLSKKQLLVIHNNSSDTVDTYIVDVDNSLNYKVGSTHTISIIKMTVTDKVAAGFLFLFGVVLIVLMNFMLKEEMGWKFRKKV